MRRIPQERRIRVDPKAGRSKPAGGGAKVTGKIANGTAILASASLRGLLFVLL
jgi:hypothetical protein